jgi:site-specific DNA recombinase
MSRQPWEAAVNTPRTKRNITDLKGARAGLYCRVSQVSERNRDDYRTTGQEKSTEDQEAVGREWAHREGATVAEVYSDPGRSASRFATKARENFDRLIGDIKAGKLDLIWFWELSRSQRRLGVFAELRDLCRDMGVLWVIRDRVYDPDNYGDMMTLGMLSVVGETESELISERVKRGRASGALAGTPAGKVPYGYVRRYDPVTKRFAAQDPDVLDGDGRPVTDSPAFVVKEVFTRYAAGHPLTTITADLTARRLPTPKEVTEARLAGRDRPRYGEQSWDWGSIRQMLTNPVYIARRVHQGKIVTGVTGRWPPLVDEETFWAVQKVLSDTSRRTNDVAGRPGGARHLLSFIARCGACGGPLVRMAKADGSIVSYVCHRCHRVGVKQEHLDLYAERVIKRWLSDPANFGELMRRDDSAAAAGRADAARLRAELEECRRLGAEGEISLVLAGRREKELLTKLTEAEQRIAAAALPPVLANNLGPHAAAAWDDLTLPVKRRIIREIADITVRPIGPGRHGIETLPHRVTWTWKLGDGGGLPGPEDLPPMRADRARELLRATPEATDREIAAQAGYGPKNGHIDQARRELEDAGEIPVFRRRGRGPAVNLGYQSRLTTK